MRTNRLHQRQHPWRLKRQWSANSVVLATRDRPDRQDRRVWTVWTDTMDSQVNPEIADHQLHQRQNFSTFRSNNARANRPAAILDQLVKKAKTDQPAMLAYLALMANLEIKDHADHPAHQDQEAHQVRKALQEKQARSCLANQVNQADLVLPANQVHPAPVANQAKEARTEQLARQAHLETLDHQEVLARVEHQAVPETLANQARQEAANTAHQLVWLLDIKRNIRKRFMAIFDNGFTGSYGDQKKLALFTFCLNLTIGKMFSKFTNFDFKLKY